MIPPAIVEHVRNGGCACDLCPCATWQCGGCTIPDQAEALAAKQPNEDA